MKQFEKILEEDIEVTINGVDGEYNIECYDGYGIGTLVYSENTSAPKKIKLTYPKLADIRADLDKAHYCLKYRGLYDLAPIDLHQGDIMMALGVAEVIEE